MPVYRERTFIPEPGGPVKDGAVSGRVVEKTIHYPDTASPAPVPAHSPGPSVEAPAEIKKFLGAGLLLLAWRLTPGAGADGQSWIVPGICYFLGFTGLLKGFRETEDWEWNPFAGRGLFGGTAKFIALWWWALMWAVILAAFVWYGSPHLRITYSYSSTAADCGYFGLNGWQEKTSGAGGCPLVTFIPLR